MKGCPEALESSAATVTVAAENEGCDCRGEDDNAAIENACGSSDGSSGAERARVRGLAVRNRGGPRTSVVSLVSLALRRAEGTKSSPAATNGDAGSGAASAPVLTLESRVSANGGGNVARCCNAPAEAGVEAAGAEGKGGEFADEDEPAPPTVFATEEETTCGVLLLLAIAIAAIGECRVAKGVQSDDDGALIAGPEEEEGEEEESSPSACGLTTGDCPAVATLVGPPPAAELLEEGVDMEGVGWLLLPLTALALRRRDGRMSAGDRLLPLPLPLPPALPL